MDNDRFMALLRADGERLADVAARDLDADVPPCPGWKVRDVVQHTGTVYTHKMAVFTLGRRPEKGEWQEGPADGEDLLDWFRASLRDILAELARRSPDEPSWTWHPPDQTMGFWYRRMAQETAVHRVDVESAFDAVTPVDDGLAVDGIDELLVVFLPAPWSDKPQPAIVGKTVLIRTGDHAWRVTFKPDGTEVTTQLGPFDALLSAEPSELLLYLWGRRPLSAVAAEGDAAVLSGFRELLVAATQ
jgi:uncharacterized protein (TIGR03083 family)